MGVGSGVGHRLAGAVQIAAGVQHQGDTALRQALQQQLAVRVEGLIVVVGVGVKQHGSRLQTDLAQGRAVHVLLLDGLQAGHVGLLHMDALVFGTLPALDKQQLVLVLGREVVIIGQAAVLLANKGQDALLHQLADKFLLLL